MCEPRRANHLKASRGQILSNPLVKPGIRTVFFLTCWRHSYKPERRGESRGGRQQIWWERGWGRGGRFWGSPRGLGWVDDAKDSLFPPLSKVCCQAHLYHWIYSSYQLCMYLKTHGVSSESKSLLILFFKPWPVSTLAWFIYLGFRFN